MKRSLILFLVTTMIATLFAAVAFASYSYSELDNVRRRA